MLACTTFNAETSEFGAEDRGSADLCMSASPLSTGHPSPMLV